MTENPDDTQNPDEAHDLNRAVGEDPDDGHRDADEIQQAPSILEEGSPPFDKQLNKELQDVNDCDEEVHPPVAVQGLCSCLFPV